MKGMSRALVDPVVRERKCSRSMFGVRREKPCVYEVAPVPQTDTGSQEENSKANGRRVVKELGKLTP